MSKSSINSKISSFCFIKNSSSNNFSIFSKSFFSKFFLLKNFINSKYFGVSLSSSKNFSLKVWIKLQISQTEHSLFQVICSSKTSVKLSSI